MTRRHTDQRGLVSKTIIFMLIFFSVLGVTIVDGSSILFGKLQLSDVADAAAGEAAFAYSKSHDEKAALQAAEATLSQRNVTATVTIVSIDRKTSQVTLTLERTVSTLVVQKLGSLKKLADIKATSTGTPPSA